MKKSIAIFQSESKTANNSKRGIDHTHCCRRPEMWDRKTEKPSAVTGERWEYGPWRILAAREGSAGTDQQEGIYDWVCP